MKSTIQILIGAFALLLSSSATQAATVNWSAGIDHGFSLEGGTQLPAGSLVRLGYFRDPTSGVQLSDTQIQALAGNPALLNANFVEAANTTIGSGVSGMPSHFTAVSGVDTAALGIVGKQAYLWVLNAASLVGASQQAILYWDTANATNPDGTPLRPSLRWVFPAQVPIPGTTSIDLTDLTIGSTALGTGARLVVGSFPTGTSANTSAPNFGLAVISSVLNINTAATLPTAVRNTAYSQTLAATGGSAPLSWSISAGSLPDGLSLNDTTGEFAGTPTTVGSSQFTVQVTSGGLIASKQFSIQVTNSALAILTMNLADAVVDQNYNVTLSADGGLAPYTWATTINTLPPGITLSENGILSGSATTPGSYNFTVSVRDQSNQALERSFTIVSSYTPMIEGSGTLTPGVRKIPYARLFVIPDGRPYLWSITNGTLPSGFKLSSTGLLKGTSLVGGTFTFTVTATGAGTITASRQFSLTLLETNVAPTVQTPNFPDTIVGDNGYRYQVLASPNPSSITITGLPPGLTVDRATGWVTGRATIPGTFTTTIRATNAAGSSPIQHATIRVKDLPVGAVGTFNAIVAPVQEVNGMLGGRIDLTTTITGTYTLTLTQGNAVLRQIGSLRTQQESLSPRIIASIGNLRINLILDALNNNLVGTISAVTANGSLIPANVTGWRQTWNTINPSSDQTGYYSAGINLTSNIDIETVPQGSGWINARVGTLGLVTITGRTASGDAITTSSIVANNNRVLFHNRLNSNFGIMQGILNLQVSPNGFESNTLSGSLTWRKSTHITKTYPSSFGPLTLAVSGGYLSSLHSLGQPWARIAGLPAPGAPSSLIFTKGGLAGASMNPSITPFTSTNSFHSGSQNHIYIANLPAPGSTFNPARTSLSISPRTGAVSGSFTLIDGTKKRVATYTGIIVRTPDGTLKAEGHFLLPKLLQFGEAGPPQVLSGKVVLSQPQTPQP